MQNFVDENSYPFTDDAGHGTVVTSVAAARAHDGKGGRGVFPQAKVMCLKVGSRRGVWTSATIPAFDYAIKMKAQVSNHSYGGPGWAVCAWSVSSSVTCSFSPSSVSFPQGDREGRLLCVEPSLSCASESEAVSTKPNTKPSCERFSVTTWQSSLPETQGAT